MKNRKLKFALLTVSALLCLANSNTAYAASAEDKVKAFIDEAANTLKGAVDRFGDDIAAIQSYLDHYQWKGVLEDETTTDPVTLKHLHLNGHGKVVVVRPGERIQGKITCKYASEKCSSFSHYLVMLGIKDQGPQTTIGSTFGASAGKTHEDFVLIAPSARGIYQILFQPTEAFLEATAFSEWRDPQLTKPIGFVVVN